MRKLKYINWTDERRAKKGFDGFGKEPQNLEDVIDVMAKTKQPVEDTIHLNVNVERLKEMVKAPKENKKNRNWKFGLYDFSIARKFYLYSIMKDVGS